MIWKYAGIAENESLKKNNEKYGLVCLQKQEESRKIGYFISLDPK